jgi:hypothetical protein
MRIFPPVDLATEGTEDTEGLVSVHAAASVAGDISLAHRLLTHTIIA